MTTYLLVFNPIEDGRDAVLDFLDGLPDVTDWHASMNHAIVLVASASATQLSERVRDRFPGVSFVITPIDPDGANGVLPRATWDFLFSTTNSDRTRVQIPGQKTLATEHSVA